MSTTEATPPDHTFKTPSFLPPAPKPSKKAEHGAEVQEPVTVSTTTTSTSGPEPSPEDSSDSSLKDLPPPPAPVPPNPTKSKDQLEAERKARYAEIVASIKYHPPENGATFADTRYSLEVLKNGTVVDTVKFSKLDGKGFYLVGRVPGCDVVAENPTVSRTHAILQFISVPEGTGGSGSKNGKGVGNGEAGIPESTGLYLYDLKSTHGSFINKNQVFPNRYYKLCVGHILKLGNSTRLYVVLGPSDDEEAESDKTVTELQNERLQKELQRKKLAEEGILINCSEDGSDACTWGMGEDAVEEADNRENPFAMNFEESETFDNPKKTLRGWFEREGHELVYDCREKAPGQFICRINLPVDGPSGQPVFAEVDIKGKKKEAVYQAALQACQILDKYGVLRVSQHEAKKRKERNWADDDYYSSDEDTFLDRTGSVEQKREKRMKIAGKLEEKVETFESLSEQARQLQEEIDTLQKQISDGQNANEGDDDVDIDDYVKLLKTGATDVKKLKSKLRESTEKLKKVNKLLNIVKPASLPSSLDPKHNQSQQKPVPMTGRIRGFIAPKMQIKVNPSSLASLKEEVKQPSSPTIKSEESNSALTEVAESKIPDSKPSSNPKSQNPVRASEPKGKDQQQKPKTTPKPMLKPPLNLDDSDSDEDRPKKISKNLNNSDSSSDDDSSGIKSKTKKPANKPRQQHKKEVKYDDSDPKYSTWVPPENQKGDGKTALNEKLGY